MQEDCGLERPIASVLESDRGGDSLNTLLSGTTGCPKKSRHYRQRSSPPFDNAVSYLVRTIWVLIGISLVFLLLRLYAKFPTIQKTILAISVCPVILPGYPSLTTP